MHWIDRPFLGKIPLRQTSPMSGSGLWSPPLQDFIGNVGIPPQVPSYSLVKIGSLTCSLNLELYCHFFSVLMFLGKFTDSLLCGGNIATAPTSGEGVYVSSCPN
jgi:hypothetical protein